MPEAAVQLHSGASASSFSADDLLLLKVAAHLPSPHVMSRLAGP